MKKLKSSCSTPPDCCVIIEIEQGASLGFGKAVLLREIDALGSVDKAARVSKMPPAHAHQLIAEMNRTFCKPLVSYMPQLGSCDEVRLTAHGKEVVESYWRQFEPIWQSIIEDRSRHY